MNTITAPDTTFHHLLLACCPKSGSTFLATILSALPGFQKVSLIPGYGQREQELDMACASAAQHAAGNYVAQHHVRYSDQTQRFIDLFSLRPIILVRNIFDSVASVRDHLKTRGTVIAQAHVPPDLPQWPDAAIERFVADMIVPWYFNFYASWTQCSDRLELTYENLIADPVSITRQICNRAAIPATDAQIASAVAAASARHDSTRFNVGRTGRGKQIDPEATGRIRELAQHYAFLDLSALGLREHVPLPAAAERPVRAEDRTKPRFAHESRNLARMWDRAHASTLKDYLIADVEDPRINLQSILTRHFLLDQLFPDEFLALRYQELRFSAAMNWMLAAQRHTPLDDLCAALFSANTQLASTPIPRCITAAAQDFPAQVDGVPIDNYLHALCLEPHEPNSPLPESALNVFQNAWALALRGRTVRTPLRVVEPACGSANDYRFLHAFGIAPFLDYHGFDLAPANIANARELFPDIDFRVGNILDLNLPDRSFDCLIVHDLFEHLSLPALHHALAESLRITRRALCLGFFRLHDGPDHFVIPHESYHFNTLSLPRILDAIAPRGTAEILWVKELQQSLFALPQTHNPRACTLIVELPNAN